MSLDNGENVRHSDKIPELFMYIGDGRHGISAINIGISDRMAQREYERLKQGNELKGAFIQIKSKRLTARLSVPHVDLVHVLRQRRFIGGQSTPKAP